MGKKKKHKKSHLPFRLNVLFFVIFLLFAGLILQLGVVQILFGADAQEEIDKTTNQTVSAPVPRGKMYDRFGNVLADTKPLYSITYTPMQTPSQDFHLQLAEKLAKLIDMSEDDMDSITLRDKKDYWILKHPDAYQDRLTEEQLTNNPEENSDEKSPYELLLDTISEEDLSFGDKDKEIMAIKRKLDRATAFTPHVIKNENVTQEEYARVAEHQHNLKGINASTDWERTYPEGSLFKDYLGKVSNDGIPKEDIEFYLTRNYKPNDRVGTSGIEQEYENLLKGEKKKIQYTTDRSGEIVDESVVHEGSQGKNLVLSFDTEFQKAMEKSLRNHLGKARAKYPYPNRFMDEAMAVAMDPNTGEVLGIAAQKWDNEEQEFVDRSIHAVTAPVAPGSAVKGATLLAGYDFGAVGIGSGFNDQPIKLAGTPQKASYRNLDYVNDIEALQKSSNVYMFHIGMRIAGDPSYQPGEKLSYEPGRFQMFRNYYAQFGLGTKTGIDIPSETESTGLKSDNYKAGNMLDLAIGQYDTYTTMQLAQYVSTIANDGYRVQPRLVKEVREPSVQKEQEEQLGPVMESYSTNVLNRITMGQKYIDRVQQGFYQVFNTTGGTADDEFADKSYTAAGKTGTAQINYYEPIRNNGETVRYEPRPTENLTLVGYAPYNNPEIAFAVAVPYGATGEQISNQYPINKEIGGDILDTYFDLKEKRAKQEKDEKDNDNKSEQKNN
ncbi:peptidoglycan D,D-transpeptidase FtsI family protein [Pontibacillus salicampi]|uniref:serine-type D-Ala-D-Ala carboxypeptidase n=1 Tax=Pontibacillus salicampi TaxID=1449801 RepID=A0ABV6LRM0_9BACI